MRYVIRFAMGPKRIFIHSILTSAAAKRVEGPVSFTAYCSAEFDLAFYSCSRHYLILDPTYTAIPLVNYLSELR